MPRRSWIVSGLRRAVLEADDREPPNRHVRVAGRQLVQERPHAVDVAGVPPRETFERDQGRPARGGRLVLEPAPQQLELLPEAELRDGAVGLRPHAVVGSRAAASSSSSHSLRSVGERLLVARDGELVGPLRCLPSVKRPSTATRAPGPTYLADGRTSRRAASARGCAQTSRRCGSSANIAGASGGGISATSSTSADQNSTFVASDAVRASVPAAPRAPPARAPPRPRSAASRAPSRSA